MSTTQVWDEEADVVVLGLGSAGCAAAIAARDAGASVLVLEKMPEGKEGGNTRISGGIWFHNPDVEGLKTYLRALSAEYPIPEEIISVWSEETAKNTDWIAGIGGRPGVHGDYSPEYPELDGADTYGGYRGIDGEMGGGRLYDVLASAVREKGARVLLDTPGRELIQDPETGSIIGVIASREGKTIRVHARCGVVLATGGFEANPQMVRDYLRLPDSPVWGSPAGTGDGIKMAQKVGADLWHMDNMMSTIGLRAPGFDAGFYVAFNFAFGFLYTGADGTRCVNELPQVGHGQAVLHGNYKIFPDQKMHVIFDESTRKAGPLSMPSEMLNVGWNVRIEGYEWSMDNQVEIDKGWIQRADSLSELASKIGLDAATLEETVRRYNRACASKVDEAFGRSPATLTPITEPPFYAFESAPLLGWSNGGPRRNEKAQVLDPFDAVIPRLYAAGCISSTYSWNKDGGMHIADSLAFGRVAGEAAAGEPPIED
jgi:succinate dehydrogenase/fumarate reductase flavoprotein subunit